MRQAAGQSAAFPAFTATAPSGTDGINMATAFTGVARVAKVALTVAIGGSGTVTVALWGRIGGVWARIRTLNAGATIPALSAIHEVVDDLGAFDLLALQQVSPSGSPTFACSATEVYESASHRGD